MSIVFEYYFKKIGMQNTSFKSGITLTIDKLTRIYIEKQRGI